MEDSTFVSPKSPEGAGGFQISYGSTLPAQGSGERLNAVRHLASKVSPKLKYRGKYKGYDAWKKTILLLAHSMRIQMGLPEPSEASLRRNVKYVDMGEEPSAEFERELDEFKQSFCENSTLIFELIFGAIDFSGPMAVADANWIDVHLRNYDYGYSYGHLLWADVEARSGTRVDDSAAGYRQEVANNTKWLDARDDRTLLISRISSKFFAWCADPRNAKEDVTDFIQPYLLDHFPVSPGEDILVKMEGHIQLYLKDEVSLKRIIKKNDKEFWIRIFLSQIDVWATSHGMADGGNGEGDRMLVLSDKKTGKGRGPLTDTCNCLECDCWACNGVGFLAGEGRKVCLCYNKSLPMPKGTTDNQERAVKTCRVFLTYEPDFAPNIKALSMKEIFIRTKAHVDAEKAAKQEKGSFRSRPNPGRSDPNNRFHGQASTPMVDGVEVYHDELEECMRLHALGLQGEGEIHAPLAEAPVGGVPMTPGEQWEADVEGHEEEILAEISGAEELMKVQAELVALKQAVHQDALRAAPGTREDYFKTPASTTNLTHFSQRASTPMDRMRQMQLADESPILRELGDSRLLK